MNNHDPYTDKQGRRPKRRGSVLSWGFLRRSVALVLIATLGAGATAACSSSGGEEPKYAVVPFVPCKKISAEAVAKAVPEPEKHPSKSSATQVVERSCWWSSAPYPDVSLRIRLTAYLQYDEIKRAKRNTEFDKDLNTRIRRVPNLGDGAYAAKDSGKKALVNFRTSNLVVEVEYERVNPDSDKSYPYEQLHKVALNWAKRVAKKM